MDLALEYREDLGAHDLVFSGGALVATASLDTALALSLLLDARAADDDPIDGDQRFGYIDRRGWWGDVFQATAGDSYGSRLWQFTRAKLTDNTVADLRLAVAASLEWLVARAIARSVAVEVERSATPGRLDVMITVVRNDSVPVEYSYVWDALEGIARG